MQSSKFKNPYQGINAHLHSLAQNPSEGHATIWTSFHASHIGHIVDALNARLPLNYLARSEQSLQIWTEKSDGIPSGKRSPRPDVSIYQQEQEASHQEMGGDNSPVLVIPLALYEEEITIPSAVIYQVQAHEIVGKPVTRIELLSASNKQGGTGEDGYRKNRLEAIRSGTSLIELDYLHQTLSPLFGIPAYPYAENSHPYYIALTDCRSGFPESMEVYIRHVNQALPQHIELPLASADNLVFDFDAVYQHSFETGRWGAQIDYRNAPRYFESYSQADQIRIQQVMASIKGANA